jgi:hypothetical protein
LVRGSASAVRAKKTDRRLNLALRADYLLAALASNIGLAARVSITDHRRSVLKLV